MVKSTGFESQSDEQILAFVKKAKRALAVEKARSDYLTFVKLMRPDPLDPEDSDKTTFVEKPHHTLLAQTLECVERGENKRVAISMPPQHGKSDLASRLFIPWCVGRRATLNVLFGTYNSEFAGEFGEDVRAIMRSSAYQEIFPEVSAMKDTNKFLVTNKGGKLAFIGRGGSGTGKPSELSIIDDPLKNDEEAESELERKKLKKWFSKVIYSRATSTTAIVVIQTRWHEDDLIGWLCDPDHPDRKKDDNGRILETDSSREWLYVNIPAVVTDPLLADVLSLDLKKPTNAKVVKQFGVKPMAAIWPEKFSLEHLASASELDPSGFQSLYQGQATPEDGDYFSVADFVPYKSATEIPQRIRWYGASDHATSEKKKNDFTCLGCGGIDSEGDLWIPPDVVLERMETDRTVEEILSQMKNRSPLIWWMENETISKSFGPFLRKQMIDERVYTPIDPVTPSKDKRVRARSIQGRIQLRTVHFPVFAPWWPEAKRQMLKFPYGRRNDFVDWLAHLGHGLLQQVGPAKEKKIIEVKSGTMAWLKQQAVAEKRRVQMRMSMR